MPVLLRGHHFLCILTYRGYGYTPRFIGNMDALVAAIGDGRPVRLIEGPDHICAGLSDEDRTACNHDCRQDDTRRLDRIAVSEIEEHTGLDFSEAIVMDRGLVDRLRSLFADRAIRGACQRCRWADFCSTIAQENFAATRLSPGEKPSDVQSRHYS